MGDASCGRMTRAHVQRRFAGLSAQGVQGPAARDPEAFPQITSGTKNNPKP